MPILVNRFQINDPMPTLGQLVREAIQPEHCKFGAFEKQRLGWVETSPGTWDTIDESDCRQIKGAAQGSNAEKVEATRPSPVAAPPIKGVTHAELVAYLADTSRASGAELIGVKPQPAPTISNFQAGDRVRVTVPMGSGLSKTCEGWTGIVTGPSEFIGRLVCTVDQLNGRYHYFPSELRHIEPQWLDCSPDMPDLPAGRYEVRYESGEVYRPRNTRLNYFVGAVSYQPRQYREIQS